MWKKLLVPLSVCKKLLVPFSTLCFEHVEEAVGTFEYAEKVVGTFEHAEQVGGNIEHMIESEAVVDSNITFTVAAEPNLVQRLVLKGEEEMNVGYNDIVIHPELVDATSQINPPKKVLLLGWENIYKTQIIKHILSADINVGTDEDDSDSEADATADGSSSSSQAILDLAVQRAIAKMLPSIVESITKTLEGRFTKQLEKQEQEIKLRIG